MKRMFVAVNQNVMLERLKTKDDTIMGRVLTSGENSFKFNDVVLYKMKDCDQIHLQNEQVVDIVWSFKICCKLIETKS